MAITIHVSYVQWNPVNTDTKGTCHFVCIIQVSVLGGLSEKNVPNTCFNNNNTTAHISTRKCMLLSFSTLFVHDKVVKEEEGYKQ